MRVQKEREKLLESFPELATSMFAVIWPFLIISPAGVLNFPTLIDFNPLASAASHHLSMSIFLITKALAQQG